MSYFGLPYIHAVFDVLAWLASMTVFWLTTRHLIPPQALPANRVEHPGLYAITAGMGPSVSVAYADTTNCNANSRVTCTTITATYAFSFAGGYLRLGSKTLRATAEAVRYI